MRHFETVIYPSLTDSLRAEWEQLWQKSPTARIENASGWFESACEAFQYKEKVILAVYDTRGRNLVAILPLVKIRLYGLQVFVMPGFYFTTHATILGDLSKDALMKEILAEIRKLGTVYFTGLVKGEEGILSQESSVSLFQSDVEYVMDFTRGPFGEFSKRKARVICNRISRLPDPATVRIVTKEHASALQICFDIDRLSAKHQKGKGEFWKDDARLFYTLLAEKCPQHMSIMLLYFGNKPVAYDIQFVCRGVHICTQKAYLPEYAYYNPGFFTFIKRIESIMHGNPVEVSFGRGEDRFKTNFTKDVRVLCSAVISESYVKRHFLSLVLRVRKQAYRSVVAYPRLYAKFKLLKDALGKNSRTI